MVAFRGKTKLSRSKPTLFSSNTILITFSYYSNAILLQSKL